MFVSIAPFRRLRISIPVLGLGFFVIFSIIRNGNILLLPESNIFSVGDRSDYVSMCSSNSDLRGFHQKVIAYSLYGDFSNQSYFSRYITPMKATMESITKLYPEWSVRVYVSSNQTGFDEMKEMFESYSHVDLCFGDRILDSLNASNRYPPTWRFLPLLDPKVDILLLRDSDSIIFDREVDAVHEWLKNKETFHIMRDHHWHCTTLIPAGMWGVKINSKRLQIAQAITNLFHTPINASTAIVQYGIDQLLLNLHIWPLAINDMITHDSNCCEHFPSTRPFPSMRPDNMTYIGKVHAQQTVRHAPLIPCPEKCRPPDHVDWTYC